MDFRSVQFEKENRTSKFGELWSLAQQQIWPWKGSKVKVTACCQLKRLVTRIMHAKNQYYIINTSEDMSQVKVFVIDRRTDWRTDGRTDGWMSFNVTRFRLSPGDNKRYRRISETLNFIQFSFYLDLRPWNFNRIVYPPRAIDQIKRKV